MNWLKKEQTDGGKQPYLFTQCEPNYCRSFAPLQDTPAIKATYSAKVTVMKGVNVVMSAERVGDAPTPVGTDKQMFEFKLDIKIPSYLLALAVGDIKVVELGTEPHPTYLICEPLHEAEYTKTLVNLTDGFKRAEDYLNVKYIWGEYALLILPASFPYGGMENPLMTFASPTIMQ